MPLGLLDLGLIDGQNWGAAALDAVEAAINYGPVICTSATRPAGVVGRTIFETDTGRLYVCTVAGTPGTWKFLASTTSEERASLRKTFAGNTDATASAAPTFVDWFTVGTAAIPPWATAADLNIVISGITGITAGSTGYYLRAQLANGTSSTEVVETGASTTARWATTLACRVTFTNTGNQSLTVQASRFDGTGQWRADTGTVCNAQIAYR